MTKTFWINILGIAILVAIIGFIVWGISKISAPAPLETPKETYIKSTSSEALETSMVSPQEFIEHLPKIQNDPFGEKAISGLLLRFPIFVDLLGTEIGLTDNQKMHLAQIVKEEEDKLRTLRQTTLSGEEYNTQHDAILKTTDDEIRQILSPIQYVRFRDWIIEQWILECNQDALRYGLPLIQLTPTTTKYWTEFMRIQLNLSSEIVQAINQLIYQTKQDVLSLRKSLVELAADPTVPLSKIQEEGEEVIRQIHNRVQTLESDLMRKLPLNKRTLYRSYTIPTKSRSDVKGDR